MSMAGDESSYENITLSKALFGGSLMSLAAIDTVNRLNQFGAELAYCQSRQAVRFLIERFGMEAISDILKTAVDRKAFWEGFTDVTQMTPFELESRYRNYLMQNHSRFFWIFDEYLLWIGVTILFMIGSILAIMRKKRKMKLMEQQEKKEEETDEPQEQQELESDDDELEFEEEEDEEDEDDAEVGKQGKR